MYQVRRPAQSEFAPVRNLKYHVLRWGQAQSELPPLVLMHGWMDVAASYQFVVDAFSPAFFEGRSILAADWRGFGQTACPGHDNYHFSDYLADLDFLLDHYAGERAVDLVGHSMGGNVVSIYAGVRPLRVRRLVNLEGFGMPATRPEQAPARYARWMDELKRLHRGELALKTYPDARGVAHRLMKTNPRLAEERALWLARQWARVRPDGQWEIQGDAAHKIVNAQLYRVEEVLAAFAAISAPTLFVLAQENQLQQWWKDQYTLSEFHQRLQSIARLRVAHLADAGHMLHHDQPAALAALLEDFLA